MAVYQSDLENERSEVPALEAQHCNGQSCPTPVHHSPTLPGKIGDITLEGPVVDQIFNM
jgi:hypothetical protein